ncbi:hypothetical protein JXA85_04040 [Candidatus Woesearchaeota archaeon]|nr:hypothetical protein [Candidatus Woesearchaeota archaeon]
MVGKAQTSVEYVVVIGFALLLLVPVILIFFIQSDDLQDTVNQNQARKVAREIVDSVNSIYYLGTPSQTIIEETLPENINKINITGTSIIFEMRFRRTNSLSDIVESAETNITGSINSTSGPHKIKIEALPNSVGITDLG